MTAASPLLWVALYVTSPAIAERSGADEPRWSTVLLRARGIGTDADSLLEYLRRKSHNRVVRQAEALVAFLANDSYRERAEATRQLIGLGKPAEIPLTRALSNPDPEVRRRASRLLQRLARYDERSREAVLLAVLEELSQLGPPSAIAPLCELLVEVERSAQVDALTHALWACIRPEHAPLLRKLRQHPHDATRFAAIVGYELAVGADAVIELEPLLAVDDPAARLAAALALTRHRPEVSLPVLLHLLWSRDVEIRFRAAEALCQWSGEPLAVDALTTGSPHSRRAWIATVNQRLASLESASPSRFDPRPFRQGFYEDFSWPAKSVEQGYRRFRYEADCEGVAQIVHETLVLGGPADSIQRLVLRAEDISGRLALPDRIRVQARLGGWRNALQWQAGVSVGNVRAVCDLDRDRGTFRLETVDNGYFLFASDSLGFTPTVGVLHRLTLDVKRQANGAAFISVSVVDGQTGKTFAKKFPVRPDQIRRLDQVGLERSGSRGGTTAFGSLSIDFDP